MKNSRVLLRVLLRLVSTLSAGAVTAALFPGALGGDTRALLGLNLAVWLNLALVDFALAAVLFGLICKVMSHARVTRHDVRIGAVFTALLFTIGKALIGQYVEHSGISSALSAGDSLFVLLLWVDYSAQVFQLGAESTWVYANTHGSCRPALCVREQVDGTIGCQRCR